VATYVEYRQKPYGKQLQQRAKAYRAHPVQTGIRRPLTGIQMRPDTYAYIRVIKDDGTEIPLFGTNPRTTAPYANFIVTQWEHNEQEKIQIVNTFGEDYLYLFGRKPREYALGGLLLNSADFNWRGQWWRNYSEYLRGYKLARMGARAYLFVDGTVVEGYFINSSQPQESSSQNLIHFSTTMLVTNYVDTTSFYTPGANQYEFPQGLPELDKKKTTIPKITPAQAKRASADDLRGAYGNGNTDTAVAREEELTGDQKAGSVYGPCRKTFVGPGSF